MHTMDNSQQPRDPKEIVEPFNLYFAFTTDCTTLSSSLPRPVHQTLPFISFSREEI